MSSPGTRRRGRLTSIADDEVGGPTTRVRNRGAVGWLLVHNRLYAPDPLLRTSRGLAAALTTLATPPVDHSTVVRWEKGHSRVPLHVLRRYEQLLEMPAGRLSAIVASLGGVSPRGRTAPARDPVLLEKCLGHDPVTAVEWADLVDALVRSRPGPPPAQWRALAHRLVVEMTISTGWHYLLRLSALQRLHQHPQGGPALLAAVERFIADPACQVVVDPVALLAGSREPRAEQRLLSMLHAPRNDSELRDALIAWTTKPPRDNAQRRLLAEVALDWLDADSASPLVREAAADLLATVPAQVLPDGTRRRLAGQHDHRTVIAHRLNMPVVGDPPAVTRLLTALAVAATGRHHDDGLAPRLVRQALFSTDSDMRVIAANVLNTSPFRGVIADAVAELLLDPPPGTDAVTEVALVDLLGNLGSERHRPALERLLRTTPHRAVAAAFALAHMPGGTDLPVWRRVLDEHGGEGGATRCTARWSTRWA